MSGRAGDLLALEPCRRAASVCVPAPERELFGSPQALCALAATRAAEVEAEAAAALKGDAEALLVETCTLEGDLREAAFALAYAAADLARHAVVQADHGAVVGLVRHADAAQIAGLLAGGVAALVVEAGVAAEREIAAAQAEAGTGRPVFAAAEVDAQPGKAGAWRLSGPGLAALRTALARPGPRRPAAVRVEEETQTPSSLAAPNHLGSAA